MKNELFVLILQCLIFCEGYQKNTGNKTCTGQNEIFACGSACDTECGKIGERCPIINKKCNEKCYCKKGYARNYKQICVPIEECPTCPGKNEIFACGSACDTECGKIGVPCPIINIKCNEKCYCKEGYARNHKQICVPIKQCPKLNCSKRNEKLGCVTDGFREPTCKDRFPKNNCLKGVHSDCKASCVCEEGYYRNPIGDCVTSEDCDKCRKPHEYYSPYGGCDTFCFSFETENRTNCDEPNVLSNHTCFCEDGYARDENKNCIPVKQCYDKCYGPHEYYTKCKTPCPPEECIIIVALFDCPKPQRCEPGCACQKNFLRNGKGQPCGPTSDCTFN